MREESGKPESRNAFSAKGSGSARSKRVAYTSITANYIPKARVLAQSVKRFSPDVWFTLVLLDRVDADIFEAEEPFDEVLTVDDFDIDEAWIFGHTVVEACTAIKGKALVKLLEADSERQVLYFDPDMVVLRSLDQLFDEFDDASTILTPHGIEPESETYAIVDNEISHLKHGVYNLGFVGVKNSAAGMAFAEWWSARLEAYCFDDPASGIFTDQRWVDLAPCFFDEVKILRKPGYNVATWNLSHRVVTGSLDEGFEANGTPLVFYHFSGFDSGAQEVMLERYGHHSPVLSTLRQWYIDECIKLGQERLGSLPWYYGFFDNGRPVTNRHRFLYRYRDDLQRSFPEPYATQTDRGSSYYLWYETNGIAAASMLEARVRSPDTADFQILVFALDQHPANGARLKALLQNTWQPECVRLVATPAVLAGLFADDVALDGIELDETDRKVDSPDQREQLILEYLARSTSDSIVVRLGTIVADLWDLRLHWISRSDASIATVSPLTNTGLFDLQIGELGKPGGGAAASGDTAGSIGDAEQEDSGGGQANRLGPADIDRVAASLELKNPLESPAFFHHCFYFRRPPNVAELFSLKAQLKNLSAFQRQCLISGLEHVIAQNVYVSVPAEQKGFGPDTRAPDGDELVFEQRNVLSEVRHRFQDRYASAATLPTVRARYARRNLHIVHNWGGGLEGWVRSYCRADRSRVNFVLRPVGEIGSLGQALALYANVDDTDPIEQMGLPRVIKNVDTHNLTYERQLRAMLRRHGIDQIIVSSLIGHSLDVLRTACPTVFICHDFFPMHPNIYVRSWNLSGNRVSDFSFEEEFARASVDVFPNFTLAEAQSVDRAFRECMTHGSVKMVAPCASTSAIYRDLEPRLGVKDITIIPHGTPAEFIDTPPARFDLDTDRLRVVVLGEFVPQKGSELLSQVIPRLAEIADVHLIGCGLKGTRWRDTPGVYVRQSYEHRDLVPILRQIDPHIGLLLSDFAETFSYTLDELMAFGIPPLARRIGAFADRIVEGRTGFFVDDNADAILTKFRQLSADHGALLEVRANLSSTAPRTEAEMIADYNALFGQTPYSSNACYAAALPASAYEHLRSDPVEPAAADRVVLPLADNSAAAQIGNVVGYWDDNWVAPHMSVRLLARAPIRSGQLSLWFPPGPDQPSGNVKVRVNGRDVCSADLPRDAKSDLDFDVTLPAGRPFLFEIAADASVIDSEDDVRQLAAVLRDVRFS